MGLSTSEIIIIAIVILVLFGAKRIPDLARSLGRASYEFKKAKEDLVNDAKAVTDAAEKEAGKEAEEKNK